MGLKMNAKILLAFVLIVNLCVITVNAEGKVIASRVSTFYDLTQLNNQTRVCILVFNYGVAVKTANKEFDSHDGKLKLSLISTTQEDFVLTPK